MTDRFNAIAGWVLFAGIVALGASILTGELFHQERPEQGNRLLLALLDEVTF